MEKIALTAQVREKAGKGVARGLRRNQMVPAVLYSHGKSTPIAMGDKDVTRVLNTEGGEHALINLKLEGAKGAADRLALIKDYQVDPISGKLMHVGQGGRAPESSCDWPAARPRRERRGWLGRCRCL